MSFDPDAYLAGNTQVAQNPNGFDPDAYLKGDTAPALAPAPALTAPVAPPDWKSLYSGIDAIPSHLDDSQKAIFQKIGENSPDNPGEAQAKAVNQAYVSSKLQNIDPETISRNWEAIKSAYSQAEMGFDGKPISDTQFYQSIADHIKNGYATAFDLARSQTHLTAGQKFSGVQDLITTLQNRGMINSMDQIEPGLGAMSEAYLDAKNRSFFSTPNLTIPEMPELTKEQEARYGYTSAMLGIYDPSIIIGLNNKVLKPFVEGMSTDFGIVTLGVGAELQALKTGGSILAGRALTLMKGGFAALMGKAVVDDVPEIKQVFDDPNSSKADKIGAVGKVVTDGYMAAHLGVSAALDVMPIQKATSVAASVANSTPAEAANIFRVEANRVPLDQKPKLLEAAGILDGMYPQGALPEIPKTIEAAAVKTPEGQIYESSTHADIPFDGERGYTLNDGSFVTPSDALKIAKDSGQAPAELTNGATELSPEMVKMPITPDILDKQINAIEQVPADDYLTSITRASTDAKLQRMGLEPTSPTESIAWKTQLEESLNRFEKDPEAGDKLIRRIQAGDRRFSSTDVWDSQVLTRELADREIAAKKRYDEALQSGDEVAMKAADLEISDVAEKTKVASQAINEVQNSEIGRALGAIRAQIRDDYSLAALERKERRSTQSAEIPESVQKDLSDKADKISALETELKAYREGAEKRNPSRKTRTSQPPSKVLSYLSDQANAARARIAARAGQLNSGIDPTQLADLAIIGAEHIAKGLNKFSDWSAEMVKEFGDLVKPHLQSIFDKAKENSKEAARITAYKTRTENSIEKLQGKLDSGDLSKTERKPLDLSNDKHAQALQAELNGLKKELARRFKKNEDANTPLWIKGLKAVSWVGETSILTGYSIFLKIPVSAFWKIAFGLPKEIVGTTVAKLFPQAAKYADMQATPSYLDMLAGEGKAAKSTATEGARAAAQAFANKLTTEEKLFVPDSLPPQVKDWVRSIHRGLHLPAQLNEFTRRVNAIEANMKARGLESHLSDPATWTAIRVRAYNESYRAAYLEKDGVFSGLVNASIRNIEQAGKKYKQDTLAAIAVMFIELDNPVKRVPVNIVGQLGEATTGLPIGTLQLLNAYRTGFKGMKEGDLDSAFRRIKSGSVGAAVMLGAWFSYENLGGSKPSGEGYGKEKPDKNGLKHGQMKVGGQVIPEIFQHNETFTSAQMIAEYRHLMDSQYGKDSVTASADSILRVIIGEVENMPGLKQNLINNIAETKSPSLGLAKWAAQRAVPSGVAQLAKWLDTPGEPSLDMFFKESPYRPVKNVEDAFKTRIPVLRKDVPEKK